MMKVKKRGGTLQPSTGQWGFTIVEILVALVMGSILTTAICALIIDQTQAHEDHQMKVMMQQNGRAALSILTSELMLAGYSPKPRSDGGHGRLATFQIADIDSMEFTYDSNGDGDIDLEVGGDNSYNERTVLNFDGTNGQLERNNNTNSFLENVEAFRVLYAYDKDDLSVAGYGKLEPEMSSIYWAYDSDASGFLDKYYILNNDSTLANTTVQTLPESPSVDRIRAAKIWLLIRSHKRKNKSTSEVSTDPVPDVVMEDLDTDNYSYRLYTTTVKLRNMYY